MKKHVKIYLEYFTDNTFIPCEVCGKNSVDIHHVKYKSRGGKDELSNLIALCRDCHTKAHNEVFKEPFLKSIVDARN
jgi:5-methylcytosine-specific restriction endonuclease McrA